MKPIFFVLLSALITLSCGYSRATIERGHQSEVHEPATGYGDEPAEIWGDSVLLASLEPVLDVAAAARRLSRAVQFQTISRGDAGSDSLAFIGLHAHLERSFPGVHTTLRKELIGGLSLLYTWTGSDATLDPIMLMAHQDVVPVEEGTDKDWTHPPFEGTIDGGYVWGRGTLDNKQGVLGILEAVELLIQSGYSPERTVYMAFGHDEEVGGANGAGGIAELLQARGIRFFMVLDEGGAIISRFLSRVRGSVAAVGVGEKGSVSLELSVHTEGGHSSVPGGETAIDILTSATRRLQRKPFPARLNGVPRQTLEHLARSMPFLDRVVLSNLWLFKPLVKGKLDRSPDTRWMLRTTSALTMISGGTKSNVLPSTASAVINFRTTPAETVESVIARVRETVEDPRVSIVPVGTQRDAPINSQVGGHAYDILASTIREISPDEQVTVVPFLVPGGTDSRYFVPLSNAVYRFTGIRTTKSEMKRFHGRDERLPVQEYGRAIKFYFRLIWNTCGMSPAQIADSDSQDAGSRDVEGAPIVTNSH